jgi:tetratricopeptide (TPR) repeat protein
MAHHTPQSNLAARREHEKAAANALAGLAHSLMIDFLRGWNSATNINILMAEQAVQQAHALDRSVVLAHVTESKIREVRGDLQGEIDALNEALKLNPNLVDAYSHKANALILLGQAKDALNVLEMAPEPDRGDPEKLGLFCWFKGRAYFHLKDYDPDIKDYKPAIYWLKQSVEVRPTTWFSWAHLISAYAHEGQFEEAEPEVKNQYRPRFEAHWPLDPNIREYYNQAKYRSTEPQLRNALKAYLDGLKIAKEKANFP